MSASEEKPRCLFCGIDKRRDQFRIEYEDDKIVAFHDIKPASEFHLLITPKRHIDNATKLTRDDIPLVNKMAEQGRKLLSDKGYSPDRQKLGFHLPPLILVSHLHLHVFSQPHNGTFAKAFFAESGLLGFRWFMNVESIVALLEREQSIGLRSAI